jgi:hypothetical protein
LSSSTTPQLIKKANKAKTKMAAANFIGTDYSGTNFQRKQFKSMDRRDFRHRHGVAEWFQASRNRARREGAIVRSRANTAAEARRTPRRCARFADVRQSPAFGMRWLQHRFGAGEGLLTPCLAGCLASHDGHPLDSANAP